MTRGTPAKKKTKKTRSRTDKVSDIEQPTSSHIPPCPSVHGSTCSVDGDSPTMLPSTEQSDDEPPTTPDGPTTAKPQGKSHTINDVMNLLVDMRQDISRQTDRIERVIKSVEKNTNDLKCLTAQASALKSQVEHQAKQHSDLRKEIDVCKEYLNDSQVKLDQIDCNTSQIRDLQEKYRKQAEEKRKLQVVWEMVPEAQGEKVYQIVAELFRDLGTTLQPRDISAAYRIGKPPRGQVLDQESATATHYTGYKGGIYMGNVRLRHGVAPMRSN